MKTAMIALGFILTLASFAQEADARQQPQGNTMPPEITVHPRSPYVVEVEPGEWNEDREWIAYSHPVKSVADRFGIRHYIYNGKAGCEFGLSVR